MVVNDLDTYILFWKYRHMDQFLCEDTGIHKKFIYFISVILAAQI